MYVYKKNRYSPNHPSLLFSLSLPLRDRPLLILLRLFIMEAGPTATTKYTWTSRQHQLFDDLVEDLEHMVTSTMITAQRIEYQRSFPDGSL